MRTKLLSVLLAGGLALGGAACSDEDNDGNPEVDLPEVSDLPDEGDIDVDVGEEDGG